MRTATSRRDDEARALAPARPLQALVRLARALTSAPAEPAAIAELTAQALAGPLADGCALVLGAPLELRAAAHVDPDADAFLRDVGPSLPLAALPASTPLSDGRPLLVARVGPDLLDRCPRPVRAYAHRFGLHSLLAVPVPARDRIAGALWLWRDRTEAAFGDDDLDLAESCAGQVALALAHAAAARTLREHEARFARYRLLSHHGRDIILFIRADTGEILEANDAAVAAYGYDRDELCRLHVQALRAGPPHGELAEQMAGADSHGVLFETEHRRKDGTTFPVEVSSRGADVDGERVILKIVRDITQRRRTEAEAHRAGAILQAVLENTPDLVFAKDRDGRLVFANTATFDAFGRAPQDVLGRSDVELLGAQAGREHRHNDLHVLTSGRSEFFEETGPGGRVLLSSKSPYRDASGAVVGLIGISMDITERKQAELRLRRSQEVLSLVMRTAHVGTWVFDVATGALWLSREFEEILGLPPGGHVVGPDNLHAIVHPDDRERVGAEIRAAVRERRDYRVEFRSIRPGGDELRWIEVRGRATYDEAGRKSMVHGIGIDVTERKRAELALRESEELFARAFGKNPIPMAVHTLPRGEYLEINEAALRMGGFRREEMLGRTPQQLGVLAMPVDVQRFRQLLDAGAPARDVELDMRCKGGQLKTILVSIEPIEFRGRPCALTVAVDISDRKRAEWALLESEERFHQIAATIDEAFWLMELGPRWRYVYVSPWWRRVWNRAPDELYGDRTLWARCVHPEDRGVFESAQRDLVTGAVESRDIEYRLLRADGSVIWIRDRGTVIRGPDGEPWRAAGIAEDITERKLADRERERLVVDLRVAIAVRDDFLSVASHELRTPLTALNFHLDHLVRLVERGERNPQLLARKAAAAARQSDRVLALMDSLISVSRMSLDHLALSPSEFDLGALVRDLLARIGPDAQRARCDLRLDIRGPVVGTWDRPQIERVVHNLLVNALKYGAGQPIDVRLRAVGEHVQLEVEDRGIGIAEGDMPRIFDRFERAVSS
ncbi:MAG TPA: PAS domain S-box protein, partial [Nannocystis sp.]